MPADSLNSAVDEVKTAVIIPLFNGAPWIAATLQSVLAQTAPPAEILVVDDGSTDGSAEIARQFSNTRVVGHPGKGVHHARRHGLAATCAPLVAILDQDDLWHPEHLAGLTALLDQTHAPAAVAGCHGFTDARRLRLSAPGGRGRAFDPWESFPLRLVPTPSCVLMRRTAVDEVGGWPTAFRFGADLYMWWRLAEREPLVHSDGMTVGYRRHSASFSAQQRQRSPADYAAAVAESGAAALAAFRAAGREIEGVDRRWAAYEAMGAVVVAALADEDADLRPAVEEYARRIAGESAFFAESCHSLLFYHLVPAEAEAVRPGERRRLLRLLAAWLGDKGAFLGCINPHAWGRSIWDQLRHEPLRLRDWLIWAKVAQSAWARRYRGFDLTSCMPR